MTLVLVVLGLVVVVNCCFMGFLISDAAVHSKRGKPEPGNALGLGIISFFQFILSAFGVSDFAIGAAVYSKLKWVSAVKMPGTVNTAAVIPVAISAIIYITTIEIDLATLVVPIVAQVAGAYLTPRIAVKMPMKLIKTFFALGMLITVGRIAAEGLGFFPAGGTVTSLSIGKLVLLGCLCFLYGALNNFGLGSYTPTMATVYALGMNPAAAFPIMMSAAAFSVPVASIQFVRYGSYSRKITVITAICGSVGVLAAAFLVGNMDVSLLKWIVAGFLLYSACSMMISAYKGKDDAVAEPKARKAKRAVSINSGLAGFCLALILICTISLVFIFVSNFQTGWNIAPGISTGRIDSSPNEQTRSMFLSLMLIIFFMLFVALISLMIIIRQQRNDNIVVERLNEELKSRRQSDLEAARKEEQERQQSFLRAAEEEKALLERLDKLKFEFFNNLSHDLKTPLTVISTDILNTADQLYFEMDKEDMRESLENAQREIMRMGRMIDSALKHSSMQEGGYTMESVDIAHLLREGSSTYRAIIECQGNTLTLDIPDLLPPIYGNADSLLYVLSNLLSNANRHTRNGKISIHVLELNGMIKVTVRDSGEGVKPELLPYIFERGVSETGSGLGLHICKSTIEAHNGTISAESEYGHGTAVVFNIPIYVCEEE
ncbi:MAG: ATP-binding protein [Oscillospiraceae bacterium]|nr:ATP-binding protein [Oscillospiraceae bacterium]